MEKVIIYNVEDHKKVKVFDKFIKCDFCVKEASYDAKTKQGCWAYMCKEHYHACGVGLGLGRGQKIEYI